VDERYVLGKLLNLTTHKLAFKELVGKAYGKEVEEGPPLYSKFKELLDVARSIEARVERTLLQMFAYEPKNFYSYAWGEVANCREDFEGAVFAVPCSVCGRRLIFTHKDSSWEKVKPILIEAFRG